MAGESINYTITLSDLLSPGIESAEKNVSMFEETLGHVGVTIASVFAVEKIYEFGKEILHTTAEFEGFRNVIKYASEDQKDNADNLNYLQEAIVRMKLPMRESYEAFSDMQAGFYGTGIEGDKLRLVFEGVSEAATVLHLNAEKFSRVTFALKEIGELGTVQARQMRMLAFALPGAMNLAAQSMHMNSVQFHEAMHKGEVDSAKFLLNFSAKLKEHFQGGLKNASDSLISDMNETNNSFINLQLKMGKDLEPMFKEIMIGASETTGKLGELWDWSVRNKDTLGEITTVIGIVAGAWAGYNLALKAVLFWEGLTTFAIAAKNTVLLAAEAYSIATAEGYGVLTAAQWALNVAMDANPIGIIIAAIAILAIAAYEIYKHFDVIIATMYGLGAVATNLGQVFKGVGEIIVGALSFNPMLVKKGWDDAIAGAKQAGSAFKDSYDHHMALSHPESTLKKTQTGAEVAKKGGKGEIAASGKKPAATKVTGQKTVNIHISIDSLIKSFNVNTTNMKESATKAGEMVTKVLLSAVNDSQIIAGS